MMSHPTSPPNQGGKIAPPHINPRPTPSLDSHPKPPPKPITAVEVHNILHTAVETTPQFPEARIGTYTDRIIKIRGRRSNKSTDLYPERRRGGASRCPADLGGGGGSPDRRSGSGAGNDWTQRKCARDAGGISEPRNGGRRRRRRRRGNQCVSSRCCS
jgi:hypothetical protein